jgi:RecJ-like exonuclease
MKTCPECKGEGYTTAPGQEREYCQRCDAVGAHGMDATGARKPHFSNP